MIALMPVICWNTARPTPIISGLRRPRPNSSRHDAWSASAASVSRISVDPRVDVGVGLDLPEAGHGVVRAVLLEQPARRLGHRPHGEAEQDPGDGRDAEHRPPRVAVGQRLVDDVGDEDADGDGQLVHRDEPAAQVGRRHLGGVERRGDGGHADAEADDRGGRRRADAGLGRERLERRRPIVNRTAATRIVTRRPRRSASTPATSAPNSAPSVTQLVMTSVSVVPMSNSAWMPCRAPAMTPWS